MSIGERPVGDGHPCYVIAEAGANHDRDLDTARRLIDVGRRGRRRRGEVPDVLGRDALLHQDAAASTTSASSATRRPHELLEDIALPREWQPMLAAHCRDAGIEFLSRPFDRQAVDELDALDVAAFKIASFELVDLPFLALRRRRRAAR